MRASTFSCLLVGLLAGCEAQDASISPTDLGLLIHNRGCEKTEVAVARQSDPDILIGIMYEIGKCRPKDYMKALNHYRVSAQRGNDEAMYSFFVLSGRSDAGWTKEQQNERRNEAMEYLQRSAELKNWRAAYALSVCLEHGACGLQKDPERARAFKAIFDAKKPNPTLNPDAQKRRAG
jgi:TPR repeat protein